MKFFNKDKRTPLASKSYDADDRFQQLSDDNDYNNESVGLNEYSFDTEFPPPEIDNDMEVQQQGVSAVKDAENRNQSNVKKVPSTKNTKGDSNNNNDVSDTGVDSSEEEEKEDSHDYPHKRYRRLLLSSNLLFVLGSALYLAMAVDDLKWAKEAQDIPTEVLQADDDATWMDYRLQEDLIATSAPTVSPPTTAWSASNTNDENNNNTTEAATTNATQNNNNNDRRFLVLYNDYDWSELPPDAQAAATLLGHTETSWNRNGYVYSNDLFWEDLTAEQQAAATVLGYDQVSWDGDTLAPTSEDSDIGTDAPIIEQAKGDEPKEEDAVQETWNQVFDATNNNDNNGEDGTTVAPTPSTGAAAWEEYAWDELPPDVRQAFVIMGWTGTMWDNGGVAYTEYLDWDSLSPEEQEAAIFLGYTQESWDGEEEEAGDAEGGATIEWEEYDWAGLPDEIRSAYVVLGYNEQIWSQGGSVPVDEKSWEELTPTEREAAITIGYTQEMWDGTEATTAPAAGTSATASEVTELPDAEWFDEYWDDLPPEIRAAYEALGYNQQMWDNGLTADTEDLDWEELTPAQQEAAAALGYNQAIWDDAELSVIETQAYESNDDDYIFEVKSRGIWVSRYMILYFSAALCFVFVGMVDWCRERKLFHMNMVLAGFFGVVSAMIIEKNRTASMACNLISVHFFLLEGFNVIWARIKERRLRHHNEDDSDEETSSPDTALDSHLWWVPTVQLVADVFFVVGAFMDVILSYFYFERSSDWNVSLARVFGFSTLLWITCSVLYLLATLALHFGWFSCGKKEQTPHQVAVDRTPVEKQFRDLNFVSPLPTMSVDSSYSSGKQLQEV